MTSAFRLIALTFLIQAKTVHLNCVRFLYRTVAAYRVLRGIDDSSAAIFNSTYFICRVTMLEQTITFLRPNENVLVYFKFL